MRRLLAGLLLGLPAAALAALGPRYGGELTVGLLDLPTSLEPTVPRGSGELLLMGLVHETLVGLSPEGLPVPALAQGWSTAASGREWILRLRDGAVFHDERPVTADDAVRSLRRFLRGPSAAARHLAEGLDGGGAFRSSSTDDLPGLAAPDPARLVLRFADARPLPLAPLASRAAAITSVSGAACGPFVPTVHLPGRRLGLTSFGAHVRGRPFLDRLQVVVVTDRAALRSDLQAGRVDVAPGEPGVSALATTLLLVLEPGRPPFDRAESRAAAAAAVDRADLVRNLIPGGDPSPSLLAPVLLPPLGPDAPVGGPLGGTVSMAVARDVPPLVSQRLIAYLGAAGLDARVTAASPAAVLTMPAQARLLLWLPDVPEAGLALEELASLAPPVGAAHEALAAAATEIDRDKRRALLHRAEAALREGHVLVPIATAPVSCAARRGVHGTAVDFGGRLVLEDAWVEP